MLPPQHSCLDKFGKPKNKFKDEVQDIRSAPIPTDCDVGKFIDEIKFVYKQSYNQKKLSPQVQKWQK